MKKKVTVKDVAKAAGVSVATVSYIMNNRTDQKISDETRKKVLQMANLLNYTPSFAAKSLATGKNSIIGISYLLNPLTPCRNLEFINFANLLVERLNRLKYDVLSLFYQIYADIPAALEKAVTYAGEDFTLFLKSLKMRILQILKPLLFQRRGLSSIQKQRFPKL